MDPFSHLLIHVGTSIGSKLSKLELGGSILSDHSLRKALRKEINEKLLKEWSKSGRKAPKPEYYSYDLTSKRKEHVIVGSDFSGPEDRPETPWALRYECPKCSRVSNHVKRLSVSLDSDMKGQVKRKYEKGGALDLTNLDGVKLSNSGKGRRCSKCKGKSGLTLRKCSECDKITIFRLEGNLTKYDPLYCMNCKSMVKSHSIRDDYYGY